MNGKINQNMKSTLTPPSSSHAHSSFSAPVSTWKRYGFYLWFLLMAIYGFYTFYCLKEFLEQIKI